VVDKAHGAALHPAGHQGAVGVFNQRIEQFACTDRVFLEPLAPPEHGTVLPGARFRVGRDGTGRSIAQEIWPDEDSDVIAFEALTGVDAPDLVNALRL